MVRFREHLHAVCHGPDIVDIGNPFITVEMKSRREKEKTPDSHCSAERKNVLTKLNPSLTKEQDDDGSRQPVTKTTREGNLLTHRLLTSFTVVSRGAKETERESDRALMSKVTSALPSLPPFPPSLSHAAADTTKSRGN